VWEYCGSNTNGKAKIFEGLAQETVSECCNSLSYAAKRIEKEKSWVDGRLFLIQHLTILGEQISPFNINFVVVQKELDYSHMKNTLSSLLRGQFSWRNSPPRVIENQTDSKKVSLEEIYSGMALDPSKGSGKNAIRRY
jgi:conserved oligomeric Golgi complex subunit 3